MAARSRALPHTPFELDLHVRGVELLGADDVAGLLTGDLGGGWKRLATVPDGPGDQPAQPKAAIMYLTLILNSSIRTSATSLLKASR